MTTGTGPDATTAGARGPLGPAVQDCYPDDFAHCYGCGRLNPQGHHLKTYWDGRESRTRFTPAPHHVAVPGFVYGGLIASLFDCHSTATAAAAAATHAGQRLGDGPLARFVTASLQVDYLKPTPLGPELDLRGWATEVTDRKVVVEAELRAAGVVTARARAVAVRLPEAMARPPGSS